MKRNIKPTKNFKKQLAIILTGGLCAAAFTPGIAMRTAEPAQAETMKAATGQIPYASTSDIMEKTYGVARTSYDYDGNNTEEQFTLVRTSAQLQKAIDDWAAGNGDKSKELVILVDNSTNKVKADGAYDTSADAQDLGYFPLTQTINIPAGIYIKLITKGNDVTFVRSSDFSGKGAMFDVSGSLSVGDGIVMSGQEVLAEADKEESIVSEDGTYDHSTYEPADTYGGNAAGVFGWVYNDNHKFGGVMLYDEQTKQYITNTDPNTTRDLAAGTQWEQSPTHSNYIKTPSDLGFIFKKDDGGNFYYIVSAKDPESILVAGNGGLKLERLSELVKETDGSGNHNGKTTDGRYYAVDYNGTTLKFVNTVDASSISFDRNIKIKGGIKETKYYKYSDGQIVTASHRDDVKKETVKDIIKYTVTTDKKEWTSADLSDNTGFFINQKSGLVNICGATLKDFNTKSGDGVYDTVPHGVAPVYVADGNFTMTSGNIVGNSVSYNINDENSAKCALFKGWSGPDIVTQLNNATRTETAGAIYFAGGTGHTISGGNIISNRGDCGAIIVKTTEGYASGHKKIDLTLDGDYTIGGNVGIHYSGGIYINPTNDGDDCSVHMKSGKINDNYSWFKGGAVLATVEEYGSDRKSNRTNAKAAFTMDGGEIDNNFAVLRAGAIEVASDDVTLNKGRITNNNCRVLGGAIYVEGDNSDRIYTLRMPNVYIGENTAWKENNGASQTVTPETDYAYLHRKLIGNAYTQNGNVYTHNNPLGVERQSDGSVDEDEKNNWSGSNISKTGNTYNLTGDWTDYTRWIASGDGGGVWLCALGGYATIQYIGDGEGVRIDSNTAKHAGQDLTALAKQGGFQLSQSINGEDQTGDSFFLNEDNNQKFQWGVLNTGGTQFNATNLHTVKGDHTDGGANGVFIAYNNGRYGGGVASDGNLIFGRNADIYAHDATIEFEKKWAGDFEEPVAFRSYMYNKQTGEKIYLPGYQFVLDGTPDVDEGENVTFDVRENEKYKAIIDMPFGRSDIKSPIYTININGAQHDSLETIWQGIDGGSTTLKATIVDWNFFIEEIPVKATQKVSGLENGHNYVLIKEADAATDRDYNFVTETNASTADFTLDGKKYNYVKATEKEKTPYSWLTDGRYYFVSSGKQQGPELTYENLMPGKYYVADADNHTKAYEFTITDDECMTKHEPVYKTLKKGDEISIIRRDEVVELDGGNSSITTHNSILSMNGTDEYVTEDVTNSKRQEASVEKYVNKKVDDTLKGFDSTFTYDILAYVPNDASYVSINDTLVDWLEFVDTTGKAQSEQGFDASKVVTNGEMFRLIAENNHIGDGTNGSVVTAPTEKLLDTSVVKVNGNNIRAVMAVDSEMYGKWVQLTFNARIKPEYYNDVKNKLAETDRKVTYTNDNVHDIRWVEVGDSATSERYKTNINVQEAVLPHDGIGNKANYTLAYKNGYTISKETNTVTVEPTTEQLKVTKIWAGDKASAPIDEEIKTAFLNALQLKLGSETVANHKFTIIEENKEENKWLIQSEVLPTYESKKYTVSEDLDSLKNSTADKIKKFFKYYSVTYSDSIDTGASPVSKSDVEAALKNSDGSTKLHDSTVTIPKGADRKIISQVNHGAGWVTAAEGDLKYLKEKYNINTAYRNDAYWGNGKSNPINIELNSLPTGTYFDITWRGNSFVDSATRKYVVINKDANASVRYSVYKQGAEGANTLANDLSNTSNGLALDVTDTQKTYVKIASSLTEAQLTEKITQSGRYLIVAENTSEHPVEIVLDENYTDGNLTDGGIIYNTQKLFEVKIRKTDDNGTNLSGAKFEMYKVPENTVTDVKEEQTEETKIALTEDGAYFTSEKIEPGVYEVYETDAPYGYKILNGSIRFTLTEDGKIDESSIVKNDADTVSVEGEARMALRVENKSDKTKLIIVKEWDDSDNAKGDRPDEITVILESDIESKDSFKEIGTYTISKNDNWTKTIENLTKYAYDSNGKARLVQYRVKENEIAGYIPGKITVVKYADDPSSVNDTYLASSSRNPAAAYTITYSNGYRYTRYTFGSSKHELTLNGQPITAYCINMGIEDPGMVAGQQKESPVEYKKVLISKADELADYINVNRTAGDYTFGNEDLDTLYYRLMKISHYGYPNDDAGIKTKYNLTEDQFRLITSCALFEYTDWYGTYTTKDKGVIDFSDKANHLYALENTAAAIYGSNDIKVNGYPARLRDQNLINAYREFMKTVSDNDFSMIDGKQLYIYTPKDARLKGKYQNLFGVGDVDNLATITNIRLGDFIFRKTDMDGKPIDHTSDENTAEFKLTDGSVTKEAATNAKALYTSHKDDTYENAYGFSGVKDGSYWLVETKAPYGYNIAEPIKVTVTHDEYGIIKVTFDDVDVIGTRIVLPSKEENTKTYTIDNLKVNNTTGDGKTITSYCLQAKKTIPNTGLTYTSEMTDAEALKQILGIKSSDEDAESIRQKVVTYAYFGPGGPGHQDFLNELLKTTSFRNSYYDRYSDIDWDMYNATQTTIYDVTDNGNYGRFSPKQSALYTAFKEALAKKTYADVLQDVKTKTGYANVSVGLNILKPSKDDYQTMLSIENIVFSNYSFNYMDDFTEVELPSTGGKGTTIFYIVGAAAAAGAIVVLEARNKYKNSNKVA